MFDVRVSGDGAATLGAAARLGYELRATVRDPVLATAAAEVVRRLSSLVVAGAVHLGPGKMVDWSSWRLHVTQTTPGVLDLGEVDGHDLARCIPGIDHTVAIWLEQAGVCDAYGSSESETAFNDLVAVSPGVLANEDRPVEGVRPWGARTDGASGWFVFEEGYDGGKDGFATMRRLEAAELIVRRPYLAKFLALAPGFCFRVAPDGARRVWRDRPLAK